MFDEEEIRLKALPRSLAEEQNFFSKTLSTYPKMKRCQGYLCLTDIHTSFDASCCSSNWFDENGKQVGFYFLLTQIYVKQ